MRTRTSLKRPDMTRWLLIITLLASPAAWAHGNLDTRPFIAGLQHVFAEPMCYAIAIGLAAASANIKEQQLYTLVLTSMAGVILTYAMLAWADLSPAASQVIAACAAALLGLVAIAGRSLPRFIMGLLAFFAGGSACVAAQLDQWQWESALGLIAALAFVLFVIFAALRDLSRWHLTQRLLPLAQRIAGAWIACIGLLLLALWSRSAHIF
jgi:hypothetical protein